jgi:MFS family permease
VRAAWPPGAARRLLPIGLGTLAVPLDTAVNIAFPEITGHFGLTVPMIQWIVVCYVLTYGSLMLAVGRLGDILGHTRVFRLGLAWSAAAFLLCALAPGYGWLLACRVLQGIGAALLISCGPALVTLLFPEALRARMLGLYTLAFAAGAALGPLLGGVLVQLWGWEAVFWFRAPLALAALLLLPRLPAPPRGPAREPFDLPGAALLALAIGGLLLVLGQARRLVAGEPWALLLGAAALAALAGFLRQARRSPRPIIAPDFFRLPGIASVNVANVLVNFAGFAVLLFLPYHLLGSAGLSAGAAGLVLAAGPLGSMVAAPAGGWLLGRVPPRRLALAGAVLTAVGLGLIGLPGREAGLGLLVAALLAQGAGLGLFQVAQAETVTAAMPRADRGVAGSLTMVTRTLGVVSAASLLALLFGAAEAAALRRGATAEEAFLEAFRLAFLLAAAVAAAAAALLARAPRRAARGG